MTVIDQARIVALRGPSRAAVRWVKKLARLVVVELRWWLRALVMAVRAAPRRAMLWAGGVAGSLLWAWDQALSVLLLLALIPGLWARFWPVSWAKHRHLVWRRQTARRVRRDWPTLLGECGLGRQRRGRDGQLQLITPALVSSGWSDPDVWSATPQLLLGQTVDDIHTAAEALRVAVGAPRVRVVPNAASTACVIRFQFGDPLAATTLAQLPLISAPVQIERAVMGVQDDGRPFVLPVRISTLGAGSSGSGKASAMWMLLLNLAPAILVGLVQVHGIDLKGGAELGLGQRLLTRYARTLPEAVLVLEDAVAAMTVRLNGMAGRTRTHVPSVAAPMVLVLIDELAMLTAYSTDRDLVRRADTALRTLLALGRAASYVVHGFLQDPRKDTLPQRHLINQAYGLRLREREETTMVLSDGAVAAGALCHKIPHTMQGVGYALDENGQITRFRLHYVTDALIGQLAARFPAPRQIPVVVPVPEQPAPKTPRAPRAPRSPRGSRNADDQAASR